MVEDTPSPHQLYSCLRIIEIIAYIFFHWSTVAANQTLRNTTRSIYGLLPNKIDGIAGKMVKAQPCWNLPECDRVWQFFHIGNRPDWYLETRHRPLPSKQKSSLAEEDIWSLWSCSVVEETNLPLSFRVFRQEVPLGYKVRLMKGIPHVKKGESQKQKEDESRYETFVPFNLIICDWWNVLWFLWFDRFKPFQDATHHSGRAIKARI